MTGRSNKINRSCNADIRIFCRNRYKSSANICCSSINTFDVCELRDVRTSRKIVLMKFRKRAGKTRFAEIRKEIITRSLQFYQFPFGELIVLRLIDECKCCFVIYFKCRHFNNHFIVVFWRNTLEQA